MWPLCQLVLLRNCWCVLVVTVEILSSVYMFCSIYSKSVVVSAYIRYMYTSPRTCTQSHIRVHKPTCMYTSPCTCTQARVHVHKPTYMYTSPGTCTQAHVLTGLFHWLLGMYQTVLNPCDISMLCLLVSDVIRNPVKPLVFVNNILMANSHPRTGNLALGRMTSLNHCVHAMIVF